MVDRPVPSAVAQALTVLVRCEMMYVTWDFLLGKAGKVNSKWISQLTTKALHSTGSLENFSVATSHEVVKLMTKKMTVHMLHSQWLCGFPELQELLSW